MLLLITHPTVFKLLFLLLQRLFVKPEGVPASHDVVGDDAAQRVGHNRDFPSFLLKLWIPGAEERVQPVQLLLQPFHQLFQEGTEKKFNINILSLLFMYVHTLH